MRILLLIISIAVIFTCCDTPDPITTQRSVHIEPVSSTQSFDNATGFFVKYKNNNYFLTNWHVLTGRENADTTMMQNGAKGPDSLKLAVLLKSTDNNQIEIGMAHIPRNADWIQYAGNSAAYYDIVAIEWTDPMPDAIVYTISEQRIQRGDKVDIIGFPFAVAVQDSLLRPWEMKATIITDSVKNIDSNFPVQTIEGKLGIGLAGAPVLKNNNLVGIYAKSSTRNIDSLRNHNTVGSFYTSDAIRNLIDSGKVIKPQ